MDQSVYDNIKAAYDKLRQDAEFAKNEVVKKTYESCPDLKKVDDEIKKLGLSSIKAVIEHTENFDFEGELNKLSKERDSIIKKNKIPFDFDKPKYHCTKCNDTGVVDNKRCDCFYDLLRAEEIKLTNFEESLSINSFSSFDLNYYSDEKIPGTNISYKQYISGILNTAKKYAKGEIDVKNLLFFGQSASGKTLIASCIANEFINNLKSVLYFRSTRFVMMYEDYKFKRNDDDDNEIYIKRAYDCDLLILDELGNEFINQKSYSYQFLFDLIAERIDKFKNTILISEMTIDEFITKYGEKFTNKIKNNFETVEFIKK